jgi:lipoprotein-anchoring transpeptidase ErfK/SrfK
MRKFLVLGLTLLTIACSKEKENPLDSFDPRDPEAQKHLDEMDKAVQQQTGKDVYIPKTPTGTCYRHTCSLYAYINKGTQRLSLYEKGSLIAEWDVSTGAGGYETPDFDRHPNGRIYDSYESKTYPGGSYIKTDENGRRVNLGNMPYAVFIEGGYAIHGTGRGNWRKLGSKASHGCIRVHPDNAETFNRLVRKYGISETWITVE